MLPLLIHSSSSDNEHFAMESSMEKWYHVFLHKGFFFFEIYYCHDNSTDGLGASTCTQSSTIPGEREGMNSSEKKISGSRNDEIPEMWGEKGKKEFVHPCLKARKWEMYFERSSKGGSQCFQEGLLIQGQTLQESPFVWDRI